MNDRPSRLTAFIAELRHRRVFRVAIVYAGVAFIIFQIVDATFDYLPIPAWVGTALIVVLLLCFPIAVGMAWAFDLTEEGLVRAKPKREPTAAKAPHHVVIGNKTLAVIAILAVSAAAWSWWGRPSQEATLGERSIAVLPFVNYSEEEGDWFSDGITDDILTHLSKIGDLKVIARTSVMQYKNTEKRIRDIGRELGVATLLEGSVRRADSRVRITSQLVDAKTEEHLWAETYDRDLTDIFAIQSDVAQQIAKALKATLTPEEKSYIERKPTDNLEAYDYYIQGNNFWYRQWLGYSRREIMVNSVEMYEKAVELDPNFALAWTRLARVHLRSYTWWRTDPTPERLEQAQRSLDHALALDPEHPEVILAHGYYYYWTEDFRQALEYFQQALVKAPNNSEILGAVGIAQRRLGEWETALDFFKPALQSDPRHIERIEHLSFSYGALRRWREAEHYADLMIQLEPEARYGYDLKLASIRGSSGDLQKMRQVLAQGARHGVRDREFAFAFDVYDWEIGVDMYAGNYQEAVDRIQSYDNVTSFGLRLAHLYRLMGRPQQAAAHYDSARIVYEAQVAKDPGDPIRQAYLGQVYAGLGRRDDALRQADIATTLKSVEQDALMGTRTLIGVLRIYILLGDYDRAFDLLEQLLSIPSEMNLNIIRLDPDYKPLREHPRFEALLEKYGGGNTSPPFPLSVQRRGGGPELDEGPGVRSVRNPIPSTSGGLLATPFCHRDPDRKVGSGDLDSYKTNGIVLWSLY